MNTHIITTQVGQMDSYAAGKLLVQQAMKKAGGEGVPSDLAIVFASSNHNYPQVMKGILDVLPDIPIIGCSTAGEFTDGGYSNGGVASAFLSSSTHQFSLGIGQHFKESPQKAITEAFARLDSAERSEFPHRMALMFVDGLVECGDDEVMMASKILGTDVKLAGGAAGDNLAFQRTHILHNGQAYTNSVGFCLIHSKVPVRTAATHGHFPFGETMTITRAESRRIYEIDGKNAFHVWQEATRQRREELISTNESRKIEHLHEHHLDSNFEMGILSEQGGYKLRGISLIPSDNSLEAYAAVAEGDRFRIMYSDEASQLDALRQAASLALAHRTIQPAGALIFDCVSRVAILGERYPECIHSYAETLRGIPVLGIQTYGEICVPSLFFEGFLNTTNVIVILPD